MPSRKHLTPTAAGPLAIGIDMGGTSVKQDVCRGTELLFQPRPIPTRNFRGTKDLLAAVREAILGAGFGNETGIIGSAAVALIRLPVKGP